MTGIDLFNHFRIISLIFFSSRFSVLVATDVAARGIDIPELDLIVMTQPPERSETYVRQFIGEKKVDFF